MIIVYITNPTKKEAKKIAKHLLSKKLIACANIIESASLYSWKSKLVDDKEYIMIAKTVNSKFGNIKKEVEKIHSYDTPCIVKISASANLKYLNWVTKEVTKK